MKKIDYLGLDGSTLTTFLTVLEEMSEEGINSRIGFIPAGIPSVSVLRASRYRMLITPTPPDDSELEKVSLFQSKMEIFYDSTVRKPPKTWKQFAESKYVEVRFSDTETSLMALPSLDTSTIRRIEEKKPGPSP